ncbi:MAG: chorismate synthase [Candidatus Muiribacteriaceae bacterium]
MIRYFTAGESHGPELTVIIQDIPAGLRIDTAAVDYELQRRQSGYGRGARMKIETDRVRITGGVNSDMVSTGSPVSLVIENKDYINWKNKKNTRVRNPRPGHADIYGLLRNDLHDCRDVLERASARETAARVAAGAIARQMLELIGVKCFSFVAGMYGLGLFDQDYDITEKEYDVVEGSPFRIRKHDIERSIKEIVDDAELNRDSLGGVVRLIIKGADIGLGDYARAENRLDALFASAMMSIPSVKGVIIGNPDYSLMKGSESHDEIFIKDTTLTHNTNNTGGIVGGMSNGENIYMDIYVKPVPTLMSPLKTIDIDTGEEAEAMKERSDVWVCPALGVIAESMGAIVLAGEYLRRFGSDNMNDMLKNLENYRNRISERLNY